jgi:hypothetical protein
VSKYLHRLKRPDTDISDETGESDVSKGIYFSKKYFKFEVTLRMSFPEIAAVNRHPSRVTAIGLNLVGFTRIGLGAHFLTDVLAAIFFGIIWLMLCTVLGKSVRRKTVASMVPASHCAELQR